MTHSARYCGPRFQQATQGHGQFALHGANATRRCRSLPSDRRTGCLQRRPDGRPDPGHIGPRTIGGRAALESATNCKRTRRRRLMRIAIAGCGQLARMLAIAGWEMGHHFSFIADPGEGTDCVNGLGPVVVRDDNQTPLTFTRRWVSRRRNRRKRTR